MKVSSEGLRVVAAAMRSFSIAANKHPGGSLSSTEAVTSLFFSGVADLGVGDPDARDHFVCSKGHAAAPYFFALWAHGFFGDMDLAELLDFGQVGHRLSRMPVRDVSRGIEMSTGSLGQGLSFGAGLAIADRKLGRPSRTFVLLGDGECTEGQVWEAAMTAQRLALANLVAILDANGSGSVISLAREEWAPRWAGFGWDVTEVDGHDLDAVTEAFAAAGSHGRPTVVILQTVKGKGLLPTIEGSNKLSSEVTAEHQPAIDVAEDTRRALAVVDAAFPHARASREAVLAGSAPPPSPSATLERTDILALLADTTVGEPVITKRVGGEIAAALSELPVLMVSPDAIRNSGLLAEMDRQGSWHYGNPASSILQCAIAEQDAASLAAGAASGGLLPFLFSMEGFYWRMLDQIRESIAFQHLPVLLVGTSGGIGDLLGPMVQSDNLLTALGAVQGLELFEASDANEAKVLIAELICGGRPAYLRLPHEAVAPRRTIPEIVAAGLDQGYWTLVDDERPDLVVLTAGALRDPVRSAVERLRTVHGVRVRLLQVFGYTRFAALAAPERAKLMTADVARVSVHNGPSSVLGRFLSSGDTAIGYDGWGISGSPPDDLYEAAGLSEEAIYHRLKKLAQ